MTIQEHLLVMHMFTRQLELIMMLVEILRARDIASSDDFIAFQQLVRSREAVTENMKRLVSDPYVDAAKLLGVPFALPKSP